MLQDLWQADYWILSKIFLKKFIKVNINTSTMMKIMVLHTKYVTVFLNTQILEIFNRTRLCCNKTYQQMFDRKLKKGFLNTHKCSNYNNNQFILLLRKSFYPYKYVADWEKLNEASLPEKENF